MRKTKTATVITIMLMSWETSIIGNAAMMKTLKCIMTNQRDVGGLL